MSAPAVAVSRDGKQFAAAWMDKRLGNGKKRVYFALAEQPQFTSDEPIHAVKSGEQNHPSIAFDRTGTLWAAWEETKAGHEQIWFRTSTGQPRRLSVPADGNSFQPVVACNGGIAVAVYETTINRKHGVVCRILAR